MKTKKAKASKRESKRKELGLITLKVNEWDLEQMREKALHYAKGNLSAWVRYAARMYTPEKNEKVVLKAN